MSKPTGAVQSSSFQQRGMSSCFCTPLNISSAVLTNMFFVFAPGLLHEGDEILDVNGIDMRGKNVNEVSEILVSVFTGRPIQGWCIKTCVEYQVASREVSAGA